VAGPSKYTWVLGDSEQEIGDILLHDPVSSEESEKNLECGCKLPSDETDLHQFVKEQNGLNKTAAHDNYENSQPLNLFLLYFEIILKVTLEETNHYMQQDDET
jgi:hypothetical protein